MGDPGGEETGPEGSGFSGLSGVVVNWGIGSVRLGLPAGITTPICCWLLVVLLTDLFKWVEGEAWGEIRNLFYAGSL